MDFCLLILIDPGASSYIWGTSILAWAFKSDPLAFARPASTVLTKPPAEDFFTDGPPATGLSNSLFEAEEISGSSTVDFVTAVELLENDSFTSAAGCFWL